MVKMPGRYRLHYYVGYAPELFDIVEDPEETRNLAALPAYADIVRDYEQRLRAIVDPEATDARARADQKALVERHGGPEAVAVL
jgi:choline-sulfatase